MKKLIFALLFFLGILDFTGLQAQAQSQSQVQTQSQTQSKSQAPGAAQAQPNAPALNGIASSITIYVYPPYHPINWSSPKATINSMLNMQLAADFYDNDEVEFTSDFNEPGKISSHYRSTMGHTIGHIQCQLPNGTTYNRWTSFTGQNYGKADKVNLLDKKIGAGVLFQDYIDGEVIAGPENWSHVIFYKGETTAAGPTRPRYWQVEVDPQGCEQMKKLTEFFEGFHHPPMPMGELEKIPEEKRVFFSAQLDPYQSYLARQKDPKAKIGGGCAPYGMALLKMAGRYQPVFESFFRRQVSVSERLIGGIIDPNTGRLRQVSIWDVLDGDLGNSWTYPGYQNRVASMYDPQLIWNFVGSLMECSANSAKCDLSVLNWKNSQSHVSRGSQQIFKQKYMAYVGPHERDGRPTERVPKERKQAVDGMVWRLPK